MSDPALYLLAAVGATALLFCGMASVIALIQAWRSRRHDPEAVLRLRRHAERKAAENGRPLADVTVTPRDR